MLITNWRRIINFAIVISIILLVGFAGFETWRIAQLATDLRANAGQLEALAGGGLETVDHLVRLVEAPIHSGAGVALVVLGYVMVPPPVEPDAPKLPVLPA